MATKKEYQSITIYKDMAPQVLELTKEEAGSIYQAIFRYACFGEDTDFSAEDRFVRSIWETTKLKIKAGEAHSKQISETNRENVKKRWDAKKSDTNGYDRIESDANEYDSTTYTNTVTGTNTPTISSTVTKTEQEQVCADADSVDRLSVSAAAVAEPPTGDLFSVSKLNEIVTKNKIGLSDEGVKIFHEEMQGSGWLLYEKPVEKQYIVRGLRAWAKKHVEFHKDLGEGGDEIQKGKKPPNNQDIDIEDTIWRLTEKYISDKRFNDADESGTDYVHLLLKYCPREAFNKDQIEYMDEIFNVKKTDLTPMSHIATDEYLEDE